MSPIVAEWPSTSDISKAAARDVNDPQPGEEFDALIVETWRLDRVEHGDNGDDLLVFIDGAGGEFRQTRPEWRDSVRKGLVRLAK